MLSSTLFSLAMAVGLVSAAAVPNALPRRTLKADEILVWGSGRVEVMNKTTYTALANQYNLTTEGRPAPVNVTFTNSTLPHNLSKRDCKSTTVFTNLPVTQFLDWDVLMSNVIKSTAGATVSVTEGYSISNSVSVTSGMDLTIVKDFLGASFSISYSETWTSTYSSAYTFQVPEGKYGAVVSNPLVTRHAGYIDTGCIGSQTRGYFQSDSHSSKAYGGLSWVDGTISLCTGDSYPLARCMGEGTL